MKGTKFGTIAKWRQNSSIISLKVKHIVHNGLFLQDFIQAVLLTSVFHKRLSLWLYAITQYASVRWPLQMGVQESAVRPLRGSGTKPLEALTILASPGFQIAFPWIIPWPDLFPFKVSFCLHKTCMVTSSPTTIYILNGKTKWQFMWRYKFCSKPHPHAFACQPKCCWSQINPQS